MDPTKVFNIAQYLPAMALSAPTRPAVICEHAPDALGRTRLSFAELNNESDTLARGLQLAGIRSGCRTLLGVKPGLDFVALTFALFKLGAIPVLIDPGMGRKNLLNCIRRVRPEAMIAIPAAHALRVLTRHPGFSAMRVNVTAGRRWFWGGWSLQQIRKAGVHAEPFPIANTSEHSAAAILFTSGGTGIPKGVCYEHGMFGAQVEAIRERFKIVPGEVDLPAFPLFALFSTALGTTCVIPDMNSSRPAKCDPAKIVRAIQKHNVTYTFGSPAIWKRVGPYCLHNKIVLPSLQRILMAGAPVRGEVLAPFAKILGSDADVFIPYGATEALPLTSIRGSEVLNETWALTRQGKGHCVGRPLPGINICIVAANASDSQNMLEALPPGQIGEIIVSGKVVTHEYFEMPQETAHAKISDPSTGVHWHRMGDMGYIDHSGRLWFCGRKAHKVALPTGREFYSVCCEAVFEEFLKNHFNIEARAALGCLSSGKIQRPVLILESVAKKITSGVQSQIIQAWKMEPLGTELPAVMFYNQPFPVDVRHNAKIDRDALGRWASKKFMPSAVIS